MKTITFYSYKGGVGRSLALVNIATRLIEFGKKVCVIDFDLEAPGLHLKFPVNRFTKIEKGIVDYVYEFSNEGRLPKNIGSYAIKISLSKNTTNPLTLISAGDVESPKYWKKLSSINWYDLVYENPNGLAFFLNLKEVIENELKPDFLLIDSRTGISEMSGITLSLLADEIVIVAANNRENLSGASKIIKSLYNPDNNILGIIPKISFVLSRIPFTETPEDKSKEHLLSTRIIREYLNPYVSEINIIHSDRELEENEKVKIAYEKDEATPQISIDYLRLFEKLTKQDLSEAEISRFKNIRESEKNLRLANVTDNPFLKLDYLSKAIQYNVNNIESYHQRALVYNDLKNYDLSNEDIEIGLKINPNYYPLLHIWISNLLHQGEFDNASKIIAKYESLRPNDVNPLILKIRLYSKQGRYVEGEEVCSKMIELFPEYSKSYSCRANCRRMQKKLNIALEDSYKALELDSNNVHATLTLAEIYLELGRINEFFIQFEIALKENANFVEIAVNEEDVYEILKNNDKFNNLLIKYGINFHDNAQQL